MKKKYNLDLLITADISSEDIKELIKDSLEESTGRKISKVDFKIGKRYEGYGEAEHQVEYFDGAHVVFEKDDRPFFTKTVFRGKPGVTRDE